MSIISNFKSLFKKKTSLKRRAKEDSLDPWAMLAKSISTSKQDYGAKGTTSDNGDIVRKQSAEMKDHEKAWKDNSNVVRESGAQFTLKKPEGIKEATQSKHSPEFPGPGITEQAGWKLGEVWPKGKKIMDIYLILDILGKGGMGLVYKAMNLATNRPVVIKSVRPCFAQHEVVKGLFRREAESWVRVGVHPNIIRAYDIHEIEYLPRIVAEYADAGSLDTHLDPGFLPMDKALDMAVQICWGMAYAHDKGLVHRDLKPANILLTQNGTVKVADFGLAKINDLREGTQKGTSLRGAGARLTTVSCAGTPAYMAPEQWQGQAGKEADIYSFGVIMYELFCGRRPFDFSNADEDAMRNAHENEMPPRPEELMPDLPSKLAEIIFQCLAKKALGRPGDFRSIARILNEVSQEYLKKNLPQEPTTEELDRHLKIDQAWALLALGYSSKFQGDLDRAMRLSVETLETFKALGDQAGISASYVNTGTILKDQGEYDRALQMHEKGMKIAEALGDQVRMSACYLNMGGIFMNRGDYDRALQMCEKSLKIDEALGDQAGMIKCYNSMGGIFMNRGDYDRALQMCEKSLRIAETLGDQAGMCACYNNMGTIFAHRGEYDKALQMCEKGLKIAEILSHKATMSMCYLNMGNIFMNRGEYDKALQICEKGLKIAEILGDRAGMSRYFGIMFKFFLARGEYERALQMCEKGLKIAEILGDQAGMSRHFFHMGEILLARGKYVKALQMFEKSLRIAEILGDQAVMSRCFGIMGDIFLARSKYVKTLQMWEKSLRIAEILGDQIIMVECFSRMATFFANRGEYVKALQMCEKSLAIMCKIGDPNQKAVAQNIASLKQKLGK
jgi:serine/threonine protein kinase